jgi:hypothetical protein
MNKSLWARLAAWAVVSVASTGAAALVVQQELRAERQALARAGCLAAQAKPQPP